MDKFRTGMSPFQWGPHQHTARDIRSSHADINVSGKDFQSVNDDTLLALEVNGIGQAEQNEVMTILNAMKGGMIRE